METVNHYSISPKEVKDRLNSGLNDFVLVDIRQENEYNDWNIKGSINIPLNRQVSAGDYSAIKENLSKLPKDKLIITTCARGVNSQVVSSVLRDMDYKSVYIHKGMKGWNENFDLYKIEFNDFTIVQFVRIGKGCLSYIIYDNKTKASAVFEPSVFINEYEFYVKSNGLSLKFVIDTHAHADHFSGGMILSRNLNICYYLNAVEADSVFNFESLQYIDELELGGVKIKIIPTPGHTDGSLSFLINGEVLLCGDLLLLESPGRPDLARTKEDTIKGAGILFDTLQSLLPKLSESVMILPSHFTKTELRPVAMTLGELKATSKPLNMTDRNDFIDYITADIPVTPPNFESIKKFNKAGAVIPVDYAEELEIGPNRCAAR